MLVEYHILRLSWRYIDLKTYSVNKNFNKYGREANHSTFKNSNEPCDWTKPWLLLGSKDGL